MSGRRSLDIPVWVVDAIGAASCLAITAAAWLLALEPYQRGVADVAAMKREVAESTETLRSLVASTAALRRQLDGISHEMEQNPITLRPVTRLNQRLAELNALAAECGLAIDSVELGEMAPGEYYDTVPIGLIAQSDFRSSARFLHLMRRSFPDAAVLSFELSNNPRQRRDRAEFELNIAWFAAAQQAAAGKSP